MPTFINDRRPDRRVCWSSWCQRLLIIEVVTVMSAGQVGGSYLAPTFINDRGRPVRDRRVCGSSWHREKKANV